MADQTDGGLVRREGPKDDFVWDEELAYWDGDGIDLAGLDRFSAWIDHVFASLRFRALYVVAIFAAAGLIVGAQYAAPGGLIQQLCVGLSVGVTSFLFTTFIVAASHQIGYVAHLVVLLLLAVAGTAAAANEGLLQNIFATLATALAICLLFDLTFRRLEGALAAELAATRRRREELAASAAEPGR